MSEVAEINNHPNSASRVKDLAIMSDSLDAVELFESGLFVEIVAQIRAQALSIINDAETEGGRSSIKDISKKIRKCSKIMDDIRKAHVKELKALPKFYDQRGKVMRDELEQLDCDIRRPLINYEVKENARVNNMHDKINAMSVMPLGVLNQRASYLADAEIFLIEIESTIIDESFAEFEGRAAIAKRDNILMLKGIISNLKDAKKDADEKEAARIELNAKIQAEREQLIAQNATGKANREAAETILAAENKVKEAEAKEELSRKNAKDQAALAVQNEIDRAASEKKKELEKQVKLAANKAHCKRINKALLKEFCKFTNEKDAKALITNIAKNLIPNIAINY